MLGDLFELDDCNLGGKNNKNKHERYQLCVVFFGSSAARGSLLFSCVVESRTRHTQLVLNVVQDLITGVTTLTIRRTWPVLFLRLFISASSN